MGCHLNSGIGKRLLLQYIDSQGFGRGDGSSGSEETY